MSIFLEKLKHKELLLVSLTLLFRIIPVIFTPLVADLQLYMMVGYPVLAGFSPYSLKGLYPYPPLWVWFESVGIWLSGFFNLPFQLLIKVPLIISDGIIALIIYKLAQRCNRKNALLLGLFYAINPISILLTGFHGEFDTLMILMILLAIYFLDSKKSFISPILLSISIAFKSFPLLIIPFFLFNVDNSTKKIKFLLLSILPVLFILIPFLTNEFYNVKRELFGYSGWPDHGWVAAFRAYFLLDPQAIFARYLVIDQLLAASKMIFLFAYGFLLFGVWKRKTSSSLITNIATVFCLFLFLYGGISSQYLLWAVPFLILINFRHAIIYSILGFFSLIAFYSIFYLDVISWIFTAFHMPLVGDLGFYRLATLLFWSYLGIILFLLLLPKLLSRKEK